MIELYAHNKTAYDEVRRMLAATGKAAVIHPTGTGKSFIAFRLCEARPEARVCWLSPSEHIWHTQLEQIRAASGYVPQNVTFVTYARLMVMEEGEIKALKPEIIIMDEFHRCGAEEWGRGVKALLEAYPKAERLGLTATHIRYLDGQRDMAQELFDGCVAHRMTLSEAIVLGVLPAPKYILSMYAYEKELEKYARRAQKAGGAAEWIVERLRRRLEEADGVGEIFERHMPDRQGKYLVFCADREHLRRLKACAGEWFGGIDRSPHLYEVYAEDAGAVLRRFKADGSGHLKLLYCIDMLNEGVHVEGLSGVILCRPTVSPIVYKQQIGRALSAGSRTAPVIFDLVNNVENLYSIAEVRREMEEAVRWYVNEHREDEIVRRSFELVDEVRECRELFEELEETLGAPWERMYAEAEAYFREHGDLRVPKGYRTKERVALGNWIQTQRQVRRGSCAGVLTEEQIDRLDAIGMIWCNPQEVSWENGYAHAKAYREANGDLDVAARYVCEDGFRLGSWIGNMRTMYSGVHGSRLSAERIRRLEELGMIWSCVDYGFERGCAAAAKYAAEHGDMRVPSGYVNEDGYKLGVWLSNVRQKHRNGTLPGWQARRLEALGMKWESAYGAQWESVFTEARRYMSRHGNLEVPAGYESNGIRLGRWVRRQRALLEAGRLPEERARRLETLGLRGG